MTKCPFCEHVNPDGTERCHGCGALLDASPATTPAGEAERPSALSADAEAQIVALLREGKTIEAIKQYRMATSVGLKEAKESVEALGRRSGIAVRAASGCGSVFLVGFAVAALIAGVSFFLGS